MNRKVRGCDAISPTGHRRRQPQVFLHVAVGGLLAKIICFWAASGEFFTRADSSIWGPPAEGVFGQAHVIRTSAAAKTHTVENGF
jgi:hypothetical protein